MKQSIWLLRSAFILPFWRMNTPRSSFLKSIHAVLCRSPGQERDANTEMRVGKWMIGLFFCLMMEAVKTMWIPMNENGENSLVNNAIYLKRNDESLYLAVFVSFNAKVEVKKSQKNQQS